MNTFLQHRFDFQRRHMINTFVITRQVEIIHVPVLVLQCLYSNLLHTGIGFAVLVF